MLRIRLEKQSKDRDVCKIFRSSRTAPVSGASFRAPVGKSARDARGPGALRSTRQIQQTSQSWLREIIEPKHYFKYKPAMAKLDPRAIQKDLSVGEVAARSGLPVSTIHFYEAQGLIRSRRSSGNQRRFARATLRIVAIVKVAQKTGISLAAIREALSRLPKDHAPTAADWKLLSEGWKSDLDARITRLTRLRDQLASCIGCGCLSIKDCPLRNPLDELSALGVGPRLLDPD